MTPDAVLDLFPARAAGQGTQEAASIGDRAIEDEVLGLFGQCHRFGR